METYDEGEHNKTVYAHFGLAVFLAQCLEHELVNTLAMLDLLDGRSARCRTKDEWAALVDEVMDFHFEHTLGRMIHDLKQLTAVPAELEGALARALSQRNWLAHRYFRERAVDFMTPTGRTTMIDELEAAQNCFRETDRALQTTTKPIYRRFGITDERLQEFLDDMKSDIHREATAQQAEVQPEPSK